MSGGRRLRVRRWTALGLLVGAFVGQRPAIAQAPALVITDVRASVNDTTTTVTWTTNRPAGSQIAYGLASTAENATAVSPLLLTAHAVTITGLVANTAYLYRVTSTDAAGISASSGVLTLMTSPVQLTIFFKCPPGVADCPPPGTLFDPTSAATPLGIGIQLKNVSGGPVVTTEGFSAQDFWRRLIFTDPDGGRVINTAEAEVHGFPRIGFCLNRRGAAQQPAVPVVPVEVLAGPPSPFGLEYTIDDARARYVLTRPGRWTVRARIPLQTVALGDATAAITDCDEFAGTTLVNVGTAAGINRQDLEVVSSSLEFVIGTVSPGPATVVSVPPANAAGWYRQDVVVAFSATDSAGRSDGVRRILVVTSGAQVGSKTIDGASGSVKINKQGTTTVVYRAEETGGNLEAPRSLEIRIDKAPPAVTISPPGGNFLLNEQVTATFGATDAISGAGTVSGTISRPGVAAAPLQSGSPVVLSPVGKTTVNVTAQDVAGNQSKSSADYVVRYRFVGFQSPLAAESACATTPCATFDFGTNIAVRFRLLDATGSPVATAVARIAAVQVSGTPPPSPPSQLGTWAGDRFNYEAANTRYFFNVRTGQLSPGVWRLKVTLDDGTVHSALVQIR